MRLDIKRAALVGLGLLVVSAVPALAGSYNVGGGWEQLYFWADVAAPDPAYGYGGEDIDGDAPFNDPFTFSLAADGILRITDVWESGDYFRIWDNGSIIGETPNVPWQLGEVESDPDLAFGNPGLSWGEFALGAGDHSLQFQNILFESLYLPDHTVLVAGGMQPSAFLSSTELYNSGLGYSPNGQPRIDAAAFDVDGRLELHGSGFRGLFTVEGGAGARESQPPLVQLRHVESQQQMFVLPDRFAAWTDGNFTSRPVLNFPRGYALATVIVGGVPSRSMMVWVPAGEIGRGSCRERG